MKLLFVNSYFVNTRVVHCLHSVQITYSTPDSTLKLALNPKTKCIYQTWYPFKISLLCFLPNFMVPPFHQTVKSSSYCQMFRKTKYTHAIISSAILNFFFQKQIYFFASSPRKLVTNYVLERMGLKFYYHDGLQPEMSAGIINEHECKICPPCPPPIKWWW